MGDEGSVRIAPDKLRSLSTSILEAVGTPNDLAIVVAQSLVDANLAGHDSHGVMRLPSYVASVRQGRVKPTARAQTHSQGGACARVDGGWGWGQPAAHLAASAALDLAHNYGVGLATVGHCNHIGRLGEYVERLSAAGKVGMVVCNAISAAAPYGGYKRLLGTNPIALSAPRASGRPPIVVDFATASVAEGKLRVALAAGTLAPPGALVDREGRSSQDPTAFYEGGALTTFGGHKGFGLSVMVELIGGILSGSGPSSLPGYDQGNGTLMLAIDIERYLPAAAFTSLTEEFCDELHATPPAQGFDQVVIPGEPEWRSRERRKEEGVPVPDSTYAAISSLVAELGLQPELHDDPLY